MTKVIIKNKKQAPKKCPYCGCHSLVQEYNELRCDHCDIIVAEKIDGNWVTD